MHRLWFSSQFSALQLEQRIFTAGSFRPLKAAKAANLRWNPARISGTAR
jgi:hypothetical protein